MLVGLSAVRRNRFQKMRSQQNISRGQGFLHFRQRPHNEDVGIEIDDLIRVTIQEQVQKARLEGRAQFGHIVLEAHLIKVRQGQFIRVQDVHVVTGGNTIRQSIHDQDVKLAVRLMLGKGLGKNLGMGQVIPADNRAGGQPRPRRSTIRMLRGLADNVP